MRNDDRMIKSGGKVPFSWENTPGVSKPRNDNRDYGGRDPSSSPTLRISLPPPPSLLECKRKPKLHEMQIPLPPCTFPTPAPHKDGRSRGGTNPKKGEKNRKKEGDHDPFFVAYEVCTEVGGSARRHDTAGGSGAGRLRDRLMMGLSCKTSDACSVREGNLERIPRLS